MTYETILWLGQDYEGYGSAYYQNDLFSTYQDLYTVYTYGPGFDGYSESDDIHDVLQRLPAQPDLIVVANTWEVQDEAVDEFSPHPDLSLGEIDIPKLMFLNKEYKKLDLKLEYIRNNGVDYVTSVLKHRCAEWESKTGATFIWEPFGIDLSQFNYDPSISETYDLAFTGSIHERWIDERQEVKDHLFKNKYKDFKWWHNFIHTRRFKERYDGLTIYWGEWDHKNLCWRSRAPFGERYVTFLNKCKAFLNTLSAEDIFNPRFWELMATKTLIICPSDDYYGLLEDEVNCVMYDDLSEFDELLHYYAAHDQERQKIVDRAHEEIKRYSWESVAENLMSKIQ